MPGGQEYNLNRSTALTTPPQRMSSGGGAQERDFTNYESPGQRAVRRMREAVANIPYSDTRARAQALFPITSWAGLPRAADLGLIDMNALGQAIPNLGDIIVEDQDRAADARHRHLNTGLITIASAFGGGALLAPAGGAGAGAAEAGAASAGAGSTAAAGATMPAAIVDSAAIAEMGAAGVAGGAAGATLMPPAVVDSAAIAEMGTAGAAAPAAAEATGAAQPAGASATMPPAVVDQPAIDAMGAGASSKSGAGGLTLKEGVQAAQAGASILGTGMMLTADTPTMGDVSPPTPPELPREADIQKQNAIDPDLSAIRKKNALLFGLDSPSATDLTRGNATTGNLGRVTLLGGTSRLG